MRFPGGLHRMRNISEYIYEISGVKLIAGFPSATVAAHALLPASDAPLWVVLKFHRYAGRLRPASFLFISAKYRNRRDVLP